ncbi:MAG: hypothetical protein IJW87_06615 [Clostridia bacterium]|nr:hypothetical protein [Clostridia bacterium]
MNLYINLPAYYSKMHHVDDGLRCMCYMISQRIDVRSYTDFLDSIGITPIIVPESEKGDKRWAEYRKVNRRYRIASVSLYSDYDAFCQADADAKKIMILENILRSLHYVKERLNTRFDYEYIKDSILAVARDYIEAELPF